MLGLGRERDARSGVAAAAAGRLLAVLKLGRERGAVRAMPDQAPPPPPAGCWRYWNSAMSAMWSEDQCSLGRPGALLPLVCAAHYPQKLLSQ